MDTKYFKKFDLEQARAGAPIRTASHDVEILKWDARSPNPIIGIIKTGLGEVAWSWPADGGGINDAQRLIMAPLGRCEGEPVWWGDILFDAAGRAVEFTAIVPDDFDFSAYTRKAAPKWPKTTLTSRQLCDMDDGTAGRDGDAYITFANKIIAHECETGTLVPADRLRPIVRGVLGQYGIDADGYALDAIITAVRAGGEQAAPAPVSATAGPAPSFKDAVEARMKHFCDMVPAYKLEAAEKALFAAGAICKVEPGAYPEWKLPDMVPAAMLEKVAREVRDQCALALGGRRLPGGIGISIDYGSPGEPIAGIDLRAIVKSVREAA